MKHRKENRGIFDILGSDVKSRSKRDPRSRTLITPKRILWETAHSEAYLENSQSLLENSSSQISVTVKEACVFHNAGGVSSLLLDFGVEMHGGIQIASWYANTDDGVSIRVRFGESIMEAMSELGGVTNSTNDHAGRDMNVKIENLSMTIIGETGFRFVRIDLLDANVTWSIQSIQAIFVYRDIPYLGSFRTNDELLNRIWDTGAYTVHLNMQQYIWDGIKRDRLVWMGDLHPEISTIYSVFGDLPLIRESLDFVADETDLPGWMNQIPAYSMWWIINQCDYFMQSGNIEYLKQQKEYLTQLSRQLSGYIREDGKDITPENRFLDWPTSNNKLAVDAGLQALHIIAVQSSIRMFEILGEVDMVECCKKDLLLLKQYSTEHNGSKQAAALQALAGLEDVIKVNSDILSKEPSQGMSTFMGYYILLARAKAGDISGALEVIRQFWGGMLKLGATTFWEDFDIQWMRNAAPIDEFPKEGQVDLHGTCGNYCYKGYRHSLCHGWSSGPTAWLTRYILGIEVVAPGCRIIHITPNLCDLDWAEGTYPTPYGLVKVRHEKKADGEILTWLEAPKEIHIVVNSNLQK